MNPLKAAAVIAALVFAGCSNSSSTPSVALLDVAGEYSGTVQDSLHGSGTATTVLSQQGSAVTGTIALTSGAGSVNETVSWTLDRSNALQGTGTTGGTACTFSMTGAYSTTTFQITGSYTATTGCSGETGTFTLNQTCTNPATATERRVMGGHPLPC